MIVRAGLATLAGLALIGVVAQQLVASDTPLWLAATTRTVAAAFAATALVRARVRIADPVKRRPWALLAAAMVVALVAIVIADVYIALDVEPARPFATDIAAGIAALLGIAGIGRLAMSFTSRQRFVVLDSAALLVAAAAIAAVSFYDDAEASSLSLVGQVTVIALCVVFVLLAMTVLQAIVMAPHRRDHPELWLVLAGTCAEAAAFAIWTAPVLDEGYIPGRQPIESLWSIGLLAIGAAALAAPRTATPIPAGERSARRGALLPGLAFFGLLIATAIVAIADEPLGAPLTLLGAAVAVGALFTARFALVAGRYLELLDLEREIGAALARASRELDRFFELAPLPLAIAGLDGRFRRANPEWTRALGWSVDELVARPFLDFVHAEDRDATREVFARVVGGEPSIGFENRCRSRDGSYRWFRWHVTPATDEGVCYAAATDVTALRAAAEEHRAARDRGLERLSALLAGARSQGELETAMDAIAHELESEKICLSVWRPDEDVVETLAENGAPSGDSRFGVGDFSLTRHVITTQQAAHVAIGDADADPAEVQLLERLGHRSLMMIPVVSGGETVGLIEIYRDVERAWDDHEVDRAWIVSNQFASVVQALNARQANEAKSEFLSRMSHELRTPLNVMLGFGQILEMEGLPAPLAAHVRRIMHGGQHLLELVNDVLDIARVESGDLTLSLEPVDLELLVTDALAMLTPLAAERRVELRVGVEAGAGFPLHALADRHRLEQVLLNLVSNAIKYNQEDGWVSVGCAKGDGRVRIAIADGGPGIPEALQDRVFEPFDRLGAESGPVEGTGLGLALSKQLTEAMGGTIEVASEPGSGSTFVVELAAAEAPATPRSRQLLESRRYRAIAGTIVSIEDNPANLALIEALLGPRPGVTVLTAIQGQVGLDLAREHQPDLILLDLHLPDMPGEEVVRRLRADEATRDIPVIVLSADTTRGQTDRLYALGVVEYLTKPLDIEQFERAVEATLGTRE